MFVVKKNSEMINKTFRLPVDLVQRLTEVAKVQDVSVNNLVQQRSESSKIALQNQLKAL